MTDDRRPVRRLLRRRGDDRRHRGRAARRPDGPGRGPRRRGRGDRGRASRRARSRRSAYRIAQEIDAGERVVVGRQPVRARRRRSRTSRCGSTRRSRRQQAERLATLRAERDQARGRPAARRAAARPRRGHRQRALPDEGGAARPGPRSARSATRCARSGASTSRRTPSDPRYLATGRPAGCPRSGDRRPIAPGRWRHRDSCVPSLRLAVDAVDAHAEELVALRRDLHAHPELSWQEERTTARGRRAPRAGRARTCTLLPGTGLIADIGAGAGPLVALRADLDALPVDDRTDDPWASTVDGRRARLRPRRAHHRAARRRAGAGRARADEHAARPGPAAVPARRGGHARRRARRRSPPARSTASSAIFALHCDPASTSARSGCAWGRSPAPPTRSTSG